MKVRTPLNYHEFEKEYQTFTQPSMTVPDQSMTIREIMDRYARGLDVGGKMEELWEDEDGSDGINPRTLDLVDLQELKIKAEEKIKSYEKRAKKAKKDAEKTDENQSLPEGH